MPRYRHIDTSPRFLAVDLERQLLPGTFEHALHYLIDHELDLSVLDAHYDNDTHGAPAFPPGMLLKVVLFAYSQGIVSSRGIERACREHVTFIALSGDSQPHFTTIAGFVSRLAEPIAAVFAQVLAICDRQGLIGREMFAIDGVKLPSNASKHRSGTRADFIAQAEKLERAVEAMLARHRTEDARPAEADIDTKAQARIEQLRAEATQIRAWLAQHPDDKPGRDGKPRKSNRTDNDSAKMATSKGVIQGYTGVATVDSRSQVIVDAQAHGTGSEHELLVPVVDATRALRDPTTLITADAGYHSEANLEALAERGVDALIADNAMRQRDERLADQGKHRDKPDPLHDKSARPPIRSGLFMPADFTYDPVARTCLCPAGKSLYRQGENVAFGRRRGVRFRGAERDCMNCPLRTQCIRHPERTKARQVTFAHGEPMLSHTERMRRRIDSAEGRAQYGRRFAVVEPVFGNLRHNKRLTRFTLRGRRKVDAQWKLYCLVHNIEKLQKSGYGAG